MSFIKYKSDLSDSALRKVLSVCLNNRLQIKDKVLDAIMDDIIVAGQHDNLDYKTLNNIINKWNGKVK
jgi:hypothetical protein